MGKEYIYMAYSMENAINDLRVYDLMRLTHLNIAFGLIRDNAVTVDHLQYLDRIAVYKRINPDLSVLLSIGGWGCDGFSQAASTPEGIATFTKSAMDIVLRWDFDGIDIDWEYPCSDKAGIAYSPDDKVNFTSLMSSLREALDELSKKTGKKYVLTCAVGGGEYFIDGTEMDKVGAICDYVNLMTYDLRGSEGNITGHHTNLYPQTGDENGPCGVKVVELFHGAGVPYEKLILGSAFYGRGWANVNSATKDGLNQPAPGIGMFHVDFNPLDPKQVELNGFTRYWDDKAKAAYLFNGKDFLSYEDTASLKVKCDYVKEMGLAGLMYWAYGNHILFEVPAHELRGFPEPPTKYPFIE